LRQYEELEGLLLVVPETILPASNWPIMVPDDLLEARKNSFTTSEKNTGSSEMSIIASIGGEKAVWEVYMCICLYLCVHMCMYVYICVYLYVNISLSIFIKST
jgi:hypothetical protein